MEVADPFSVELCANRRERRGEERRRSYSAIEYSCSRGRARDAVLPTSLSTSARGLCHTHVNMLG
jgi:hypothetical protein